jgi:excisionase family DNA binding protein
MERSPAIGASPVPRLALRVEEAAQALGVSDDYFREYIAAELRWVRRGRLRLVPVSALYSWLDDHAERVLGGQA